MDISLAEFGRERAHSCCEYCRMPRIYDELPFEIDHVVAQPGIDRGLVAHICNRCAVGNWAWTLSGGARSATPGFDIKPSGVMAAGACMDFNCAPALISN